MLYPVKKRQLTLEKFAPPIPTTVTDNGKPDVNTSLSIGSDFSSMTLFCSIMRKQTCSKHVRRAYKSKLSDVDYWRHHIWEVGKGGYGRTQTQTWTRTRTISKYPFTFTQHLFFIPNFDFTAVFAYKPWCRSLSIYKCRGEVVKG